MGVVWHMSLARECGMYMLSVQISERKISAGLGSGLDTFVNHSLCCTVTVY